MFKYLKTSLLFILVLSIIGCSNLKITDNQPSKQNQNSKVDYDSTIYDLSSNIYNANQIFIDKIINEKSILSKEAMTSIKGLIDIQISKATENYNLLSKANGNKQDQIDALKKALDKLQSMDSNLINYTDSVENKQKLLADWKIVNNYWTTYYELNKK